MPADEIFAVSFGVFPGTCADVTPDWYSDREESDGVVLQT
jgi:hypothetical protein